ncbi:MAG: hypothetical protein ABJC61_00645 [Acidobacteriota bacterium]
MSLHIRHRLDIPVPVAVGSGCPAPHTSLPLAPGPELDREIERRVFSRAPGRAIPPFSTEEWTATALAELVARQTGWTCEVGEQHGAWSALWIEHPEESPAPAGRRRILSMVTASGPTRALAICRSLIKATRCPRWPGVSQPAASTPAIEPLPEAGTGVVSRLRH